MHCSSRFRFLKKGLTLGAEIFAGTEIRKT